jgi:hypothetical protein
MLKRNFCIGIVGDKKVSKIILKALLLKRCIF